MTYKVWRQNLVNTSLCPPTFGRTVLAISLATTLLFCSQTEVFGVPASPKPFIYRQPDGTAFWARKVGDERSHVLETAAGFTVLRDVPSGKWFYAVANEEGELEKSPFLVGKSSPREVGIRKHLRPRSFHRKEKGFSVRPGKTAFQTLTTPAEESGSLLAAKSDQPTAPTTVKNLVILARFADHTTLFSRDDFDDLFNQAGYSTDGACGSVRDYYLDTSHGQAKVESTVAGWVDLPYEEAYYGANDAYGGDLRRRQMAKDAIQALDDTGFDFSPFDGDGDRLVDMVTIIHSGLGEECTANPDECIWSHMASFWPYVRVDGVTISQYCTAPERRYNTTSIIRIGVICHEMGHLFNLPDLYDTDLSSAGIAVWGLMGVGNWGGDGSSPERPVHLCCWSKAEMGWLTPTELPLSDPCVTVPQIEETASPLAYMISWGMADGEYLLIENRQKRSYDAKLPYGGLLIWHVDENKPDNDDELHGYMVGLLQADGREDLENAFGWGDSGDPFPGSTASHSLTPDSSPNSDSYYVGDTDIWITSISDPADAMTFNLSLGGPPPVNEPPQISITGIAQRKDGSGHLEITFTGMDAENDVTSWVESDCQFAPQPYSDWQPLVFDGADPAHTALEPMPFTAAGATFVAVIDASAWSGLYKVRLRVSDGTNLSSAAVSNDFAVDNVAPTLSAQTVLEDPLPQSGTGSVTASSSWSDLNPDTTWFSLRINGGEWSAALAGSPVGNSSQSATFVSFILDGDDYLTVKSYHMDDWGNRSDESVSSAYYVVPAIPTAPLIDTATPNSLLLTIVPNAGETADVVYAVSCPTAKKYVDCSTGRLVDSPVWGKLDQWNGDAGIEVISLVSKTSYSFAVAAANPFNQQARSDYGDFASATTANTPPNPPLGVELSPQAPLSTDDIICTVTPCVPPDADPEDTVGYLYVWSNGATTLSAGPAPALSDTLFSTNTAKGDVWTCTVVATDGEASCDEVSSSVTILNSPPVVEVIGGVTVYPFSVVRLTVSASDADEDPVSMACQNAPDGAVFTDGGDGTGMFEWVPTSVGTYDGICFVADDGETSASYPVTITVAITPFRIAYIGLEPVLADRTALSIMWFGIPGASYSVFRSEDLLVWECVGSAISLPEGSEQGDWLFYREEMTGSSEIRFFYRVSME